MVAAASFIIGFLLIGLAVVLIAMRGGPRGAREAMHSQTSTGRRVATWVVAFVCLLFGIGIPAAAMVSNSNNDTNAHGGVKLTEYQAQGRRLFTYNCGTCHTLRAASTSGRVGPNLDELRPPKALVLNAIALGRARGMGQMPSQLLVGSDADKVASFVAATAGH